MFIERCISYIFHLSTSASKFSDYIPFEKETSDPKAHTGKSIPPKEFMVYGSHFDHLPMIDLKEKSKHESSLESSKVRSKYRPQIIQRKYNVNHKYVDPHPAKDLTESRYMN